MSVEEVEEGVNVSFDNAMSAAAQKEGQGEPGIEIPHVAGGAGSSVQRIDWSCALCGAVG